jgi:hypothetical protein
LFGLVQIASVRFDNDEVLKMMNEFIIEERDPLYYYLAMTPMAHDVLLKVIIICKNQTCAGTVQIEFTGRFRFNTPFTKYIYIIFRPHRTTYRFNRVSGNSGNSLNMGKRMFHRRNSILATPAFFKLTFFQNCPFDKRITEGANFGFWSL